ncbi:tyrosine-type recombinase/integrase [Marinobacterium aestuariivivens]|uniref:Tyrosine-type recombinase/integrase n=1 Tax=Marinobacterium aestuariivivens TaxID=1698799 RepID=A0ABW2A7B7_9GAMM
MYEMPPVMPLFDSIRHVEFGNPHVNQYLAEVMLDAVPDAGLVYEYALEWLLEQKHSENNYKTYRSELTTFLHWCFDVERISVTDAGRRHLSRYIDYCMQPPAQLIAFRNVAQFIHSKHLDERLPNPLWRPFLGKRIGGEEQPYRITERALKTKLAILSSFFSYLIHEEYTERNPALMLIKNGRFRVGQAGPLDDTEELKAFTDLQWSYVMAAADRLAARDPEEHERTRFLICLMYGCYLRISEVSARPGFAPVMGQFRRDRKTGVWGYFVPISKGGKKRTVAVSRRLLQALKRYRSHLGMSELPAPNDKTPLFVRHRAAGRGRDAGILNANLGIRQLRDEISSVIAQAADQAEQDGFSQDAREMRTMTPHSIRHTGISHDINFNGRPLSHVQADAGHDSIETTSQYLHTSRAERHESAANKPLDRLSGDE